jgi:alcohol dehydrogenase class IV
LANNVSTAEELATLSLDSPTVRENIQPSQVPIISIPTSLSGGEWTNFARGTEDAAHQKHSFFGKSLGPVLVILDPKLSTTTPDSIWLSTGIRAVDHCVETICSLKGNPQSDKEAEDGLKRLIPGLLKSRQDRHDLDARLSCQLGVIDAMSACSHGVPLGASHGIGHQVS